MRRVVGAVIGLVGALCASAGAQDLGEADLARWREYLAPSETECAWEGVAWRQSFRRGIADSQIDGRPILLWAMNGHPMGCV